MTLFIIVLIGLGLAFLVGLFALALVSHARDYCDETLPDDTTPTPRKNRP